MTAFWGHILDNAPGYIAIVIALVCANYARLQTIAANKQLKRKAPVMEVAPSTPAVDWDAEVGPLNSPLTLAYKTDVFETKVTIRNADPTCGLRVLEIASTLHDAKFANLTDITPKNGVRQGILPTDLSDDKLAKSVQLDLTLEPIGTLGSGHRPRNNAHELILISRRPMTSRTLKVRWEWADGLKS